MPNKHEQHDKALKQVLDRVRESCRTQVEQEEMHLQSDRNNIPWTCDLL